jgi:hypothetical protein
MSPSARVGVAALLVLLGVTAFGLLGGQIQACLGPLGVTAVQCFKATGVVPDVGIGLPVLALTIAVATIVVAPVPAGRRGRSSSVGFSAERSAEPHSWFSGH